MYLVSILISQGHFTASVGFVRLALKCGFDRGTFSLVTFLWGEQRKVKIPKIIRIAGIGQINNYLKYNLICKKVRFMDSYFH